MGLGSYTIGANAEEYLFVDCTTDAYDLTIDTADIAEIKIKLIDVAGTNVCTIEDADSKTIDGETNLVLNQKYESVHLIYSADNDEWFIT